MSGAMLIGLESLFILILFYGFCIHQLRFLKKDREAREAAENLVKQSKQVDA